MTYAGIVHVVKSLNDRLNLPQNAKENVLIVCACCHLFDEINVTVLRIFGAEIF